MIWRKVSYKAGWRAAKSFFEEKYRLQIKEKDVEIKKLKRSLEKEKKKVRDELEKISLIKKEADEAFDLGRRCLAEFRGIEMFIRNTVHKNVQNQLSIVTSVEKQIDGLAVSLNDLGNKLGAMNGL